MPSRPAIAVAGQATAGRAAERAALRRRSVAGQAAAGRAQRAVPTARRAGPKSPAGAVVVETVFDWPGLGAYAVRSILQSDYNAVMGFTLCTGALFVLINLLVDMLQAAIDPRGAA